MTVEAKRSKKLNQLNLVICVLSKKVFKRLLQSVCTSPEAGIMYKGNNGKKGQSKVCRKMLKWCYCLKMFEDWWT
jgi:hypothetical protein